MANNGLPHCRFAAAALTLAAHAHHPGVSHLNTAALIVAAGRGTRAAGSTPKQYAVIGGAPVLSHTLHAFERMREIDSVQVVIHPEHESLYRNALDTDAPKITPAVFGGASRQESVRLGLEALASAAPTQVLIHDAARPFVSRQTIVNVLTALETHHAAIAALPIVDTLKRASPSGMICETVDRARLWQAQTPQGFRFPEILNAHRRAAAEGKNSFTDDAALAEWAGLDVKLVDGNADNVKLTTSEDIASADRRLSVAMIETRSASGFDVHRFTDGDHVWLGGVKIPHSAKLEGHSDADVVLHALTDALLGTIGDGDIGQHFPPSDPQWKGAASHLFLEDAARRVRARGGRIVNVDVTILAEAPKVGPYRSAMQAAIGAALGLTPDRIGIKATTTEGLGFTGRREGIAAMATATVAISSADALRQRPPR